MPAPEFRFLRSAAPPIGYMGTTAHQRGSQQRHEMRGRITGLLILRLECAEARKRSLAPFLKFLLFPFADGGGFQGKL